VTPTVFVTFGNRPIIIGDLSTLRKSTIDLVKAEGHRQMSVRNGSV